MQETAKLGITFETTSRKMTASEKIFYGAMEKMEQFMQDALNPSSQQAMIQQAVGASLSSSFGGNSGVSSLSNTFGTQTPMAQSFTPTAINPTVSATLTRGGAAVTVNLNGTNIVNESSMNQFTRAINTRITDVNRRVVRAG